MDSNVESPEQVAYRRMEETTRRLMEEFKLQDETSKSRGYESGGLKVALQSPHELPTNNPSMIYTSQPRGSPYPVECLLRGAAAKRELIEYPDFPQEIYRASDLEERAYSIVDIPGKGLGMVAAQDLEPGELITSERPLLLAPHAISSPASLEFTDDATEEQQQAAKYFEADRMLKIAYERMHRDDQAAYMKLHNAHLHDGSGPLLGVMRTNSYGLFDMQALSMQLYAVRNIKKGEEITTSYCNHLAPHAARQRALTPYGILCECPACVEHVESDKNRSRISHVRNSVPAIVKWAANPMLPDDLLLAPSLKMLELLELEGLEATPQYLQVLYHLMLICSALGTSSVNPGCGFYMEKWARLKRWDVKVNPAERGIQDLEKIRIASLVRRRVLMGKEQEEEAAVFGASNPEAE
ncbi:hypothetical protein EYR40_009403 [Pleurotus pulmonarius]|nr:hypothetical protein EYR40_009403 [Pleurotus pulmonarius]